MGWAMGRQGVDTPRATPSVSVGVVEFDGSAAVAYGAVEDVVRVHVREHGIRRLRIVAVVRVPAIDSRVFDADDRARPTDGKALHLGLRRLRPEYTVESGVHANPLEVEEAPVAPVDDARAVGVVVRLGVAEATQAYIDGNGEQLGQRDGAIAPSYTIPRVTTVYRPHDDALLSDGEAHVKVVL